MEEIRGGNEHATWVACLKLYTYHLPPHPKTYLKPAAQLPAYTYHMQLVIHPLLSTVA